MIPAWIMLPALPPDTHRSRRSMAPVERLRSRPKLQPKCDEAQRTVEPLNRPPQACNASPTPSPKLCLGRLHGA